MLKTILLVDDDHELLENLTAFLEWEGYGVVVANDGKAGLTQLKMEKPDVLVTDFVMPNAGGGDLIREMRREGMDVPAIMMTGATGVAAIHEPQLRVATLLRKPFRFDDLKNAIVRLIGAGDAAKRTNAGKSP